MTELTNLKCLVFSKDRPAQADLTLRSLKETCANTFPITILYNATNNNFNAGYEKLKGLHKNVDYIEEVSPLSETIYKILHSIEEEYLFFVCDDEVFYREFDLNALLNYIDDSLCLSLRHGENVTYNTMSQNPCRFPIGSKLIDDTVYRWRWIDGVYAFAYPFSLAGTVYRTKDIVGFIDKIKVYGINTTEGSLDHNKFKLISQERDKYIVCPKKSVTVSTPYNRVQNIAMNNWVSESFYLDTTVANKNFLDNKKLILGTLDKPIDANEIISPQQDMPYSFIER